MKKQTKWSFTLFGLLFAAIFLTSCNSTIKDNEFHGDYIDLVSQYKARDFDGEKRADIFYQIFIRSFADSDGNNVGDINGVTAKLDYLNDLGVKGIWLTPIHPSGSYHGYDVVDYKGIHPIFGTMDDFERLVEEAHRRDIRIVLDFVINHASSNNDWFLEACKSVNNPYRNHFTFSENPEADIAAGNIPMIATEGAAGYNSGEWYDVYSGTKSYKYHSAFWTSSFADFNYGPVETAETSGAFIDIVDAAKFWIDKGVDGFRLDAVKHIYHNETSDENPRFLAKFYNALNSYFEGKSYFNEPLYMIGEVLSEHNVVAPYYVGLPAYFDFSSWWRMEYALKNNHAKWYPQDILSYREEYAAVNPNFIQATKLSNHDETRTRTSLGGNNEANILRTKMAGAILLTSIGSPYIYYGEEIGMIGSKNSGDENVREPMLWDTKANDNYRTGKYPISKNSTEESVGTVQSQSQSETSVYTIYRYFARLRNTYPALAKGTMSLPDNFDASDNSDKQIMAYVREYEGEKLLVIHNVSLKESTYEISATNLTPIADMNKVSFNKVSEGKYQVVMPGYSTIILQY